MHVSLACHAHSHRMLMVSKDIAMTIITVMISVADGDIRNFYINYAKLHLVALQIRKGSIETTTLAQTVVDTTRK